MGALLMGIGIVGLLLGVTAYAAHVLHTLPDAPECPCCRRITAQRMNPSPMDRLLARLGGADTRHCARCGWSGHMRWRLATEHAQGD